MASHFIHPRFRAPILAFYRFVRAADDVADHADSSPDEKLAILDRMEAGLLGQHDDEPVANALRAELRDRQLTSLHAQDLLNAFRLDVTKHRYSDWDDLISYCRLSAMPVGRYVLDVHGESRSTWPSSDALCAALQVINHLQDCGADYRNLDRVYIPQDALARTGATVMDLAAERASAALRRCIAELASRTETLLADAAPLPHLVKDLRLALEISAIDRLARSIVGLLQSRDPLSERVHLSKAEFVGAALAAAIGTATRRAARKLTGNLPLGRAA